PAPVITDRVGLYSWGFDDVAWPGSPDRLTWSVDRAAALGTHVIRVALATTDPYHVNNGAQTLADIARQPAYTALWGDARWTTIAITAYSAAGQNDSWNDGLTAVEAQAERTEIADLGNVLLGFPGKRFIILPWEGDNALARSGDDATAWDGYTAWIAARADG